MIDESFFADFPDPPIHEYPKLKMPSTIKILSMERGVVKCPLGRGIDACIGGVVWPCKLQVWVES